MFRIKEGLSLKQEELKHLILDGGRTQRQLKDKFYKCESWKSTLRVQEQQYAAGNEHNK